MKTTLILLGCLLGGRMGQSQAKLELKVFLGTDCPISQKYITRLNDLHAQYHDVQMEGIISGKSSDQQAQEFSEEYKISFPLKRDPDYNAAKMYQARVTPEVVLTDASNHVLYQGAIDNWFYELGRYRTETTEHYLRDAIEAALRGEDPKTKRTEAIGCFLQVPNSGKKEKHHH